MLFSRPRFTDLSYHQNEKRNRSEASLLQKTKSTTFVCLHLKSFKLGRLIGISLFAFNQHCETSQQPWRCTSSTADFFAFCHCEDVSGFLKKLISRTSCLISRAETPLKRFKSRWLNTTGWKRHCYFPRGTRRTTLNSCAPAVTSV